ncbi:hypothetical protein GOV12_04410 [Candidatus Pacearchaeota archaeon]|nr:hypothetical protein [Candidatus Pacearchaeota archaeon]
MKKKILCVTFILSLILLTSLVFAQSNASMEVEANIIGFLDDDPVYDVSIEVPDSIFLGNVTKNDPISDELRVYINNTGNLAITVTPQLFDSSEKIFSNLFFRTLKTSNGTSVLKQRIGDYSLDIDKPATSVGVKSKYCYMSLDLTDFNEELEEDLIGHKSRIVFLAMPQ